MTEMQRHMQAMLEEIKDAIQSKDASGGLSKSNNTFAISASACCDDLNTSKTSSLQRTSLDSEDTKFALKSDEHPNYVTDYVENKCPKMDELEAELEFELELLQLNLEREDTPVLSESQQMVAEKTNHFGCLNISFEEDERNEEYHYGFSGVPARDLEIRLHELLETRQRERITKLESALESAKRKLHRRGTSQSGNHNAFFIPTK